MVLVCVFLICRAFTFPKLAPSWHADVHMTVLPSEISALNVPKLWILLPLRSKLQIPS
jgi:hypothetical protein